jgi:hypothetical protein
MNIIKPIYVYKWINKVNSTEYIKYVFDTNKNNIYNKSEIIIDENIYQDSSKEDAINKIAYHINKINGGDAKNLYYTWVNNKSFLYDIENIIWEGYNVNPFKSTDRQSEEINETIQKYYNKSKELFETTDIINIVFKSDFDYNNKYYYDNLKFKCNNYKKDSDNKLEELYKLKIINNKKLSENYYKVIFSAYISNLPSLIIIFDKLFATNQIQLIQYINNFNKVYYKLYKKHKFKNKKELSKIFKLSKDSAKEAIKLYYSKNIVITIYGNGIINLTFEYPKDKGIIINYILKYVEELNKYINDILNINIDFKEININARIIFNAYKTKYADLIKEIKTSTVFTEFKDGEFFYKRTSNYKDRSAIDQNIKDDINKNNIKPNNNKDEDIQDTRIIVKKKKESREYIIDVKNAKTFFEFECLDFWITKIIESAINDKQSSKDITDTKKESSPDIRRNNYATSSESSGGNNNEYKNYIIAKLKNADMEIWGDDNKSRKCQLTKQPIPLTTEEYNEFKKKGLNKFFDNSIIHNKNYYICPRLWCPISNIPLNESDPNAKCPIADEIPMRLNDKMENKNLPRYVYLKKKYNIPCCGKKFNNDAIIENDNQDDKDDIIKPQDKPYVKTKPLDKPNKPNKDNYIFSTIENWTPYKRFGVIPYGLYKILYPNTYKENSVDCIKNKKKNCIFTKGIINIEEIPNKYDNIINIIAYLVGETKETFIETIKNKIDIFIYISLDNGNICKNFGDYEPVLYEYNKKLFKDLKKHLHNVNKKHKINIKLPDADSKEEKDIFKISRFLYIYKSYRKFIEYISADNYPNDKGIQYLYSLIAFVYKKILIVWEYTITNPTNTSSIDLLAPNYINDLISYYGLDKKTEIIMILKKILKDEKEDKLYEKFRYGDNIYFYEPLIIKTANDTENKRMLLNEYPNIKKILNINPNNIFSNLNSIINIIQNENKMYMMNTIIINDNYTIDKIMLKNNILIRFNPQGTIILPYLIKEFNIKNIVFLDDIIDKTYDITIIKNDPNKTHANFIKKINKLKDLGISVDIGIINDEDNEQIKNILTIRKEESDYKGQVIFFGKKSEFEVYNAKNSNIINKWLDLRLKVKDKLVSLLEKKNKIIEYSKKPRTEFIKYLLDMFDTDKTKIQIILEEIPIFTIKGITDWYANTLLHTKYDYINNLSDNFVDNGNELLFTQYLINKNIPNNIIYYHEANPHIIYDNSEDISVNFDNIYNDNKIVNKVDANSSKNKKVVANVIIKLPKMFEGEPKDLNAKWTKNKKKIWWQLKYIKNDYLPSNIMELFNYLKTLDNDIVNDYNDIITETFKTYKLKLNKNINEQPNDIEDIKEVFKDPYFYTSYINSMNSINNTKKKFKTVKLFLTTYFYNSSTAERENILNHMSTSDTYTYYPNEITFFTISKVLNISILIIHKRAEYGKVANIKKRADENDLSMTSTIYKANNNAPDRPLLMLYRKNDATHLSYYIIRNINHDNFIYTELNMLNEDNEIRKMIDDKKFISTYSSSSSSKIINT